MEPQNIRTFTVHYPFVGPIVWISSVQYFVVQLVVAMAWTLPYSLTRNVISDLGNTACGTFAGRMVCSPLQSLMNASFIMLGITMMVGSILIYQEFTRSKGSLVGFSFMALAGLGTVVVGLFPENTVSALHVLGASLPFLVGNVGLVVLGLTLDIPRLLKIYTSASGIITLSALMLFVLHVYLGLGEGGMERLVAYPQTIWFIVFGVYISRNHFRTPTKG